MIHGQCMQVMLNKMKHNLEWSAPFISYDPLTLFKIIEKIILAQTEDQYLFSTVYKQEQGLYSFQQNVLTNDQWYKRFNTKIDVGSAIGVTRQHQVLLKHIVAKTIKTEDKDLLDNKNEDKKPRLKNVI